jgi:hypothetical protein
VFLSNGHCILGHLFVGFLRKRRNEISDRGRFSRLFVVLVEFIVRFVAAHAKTIGFFSGFMGFWIGLKWR